MNNIIISALDEQFNKDCKVISTNSEYPSYTGIEKWIIITDLTEEELNSKYSEQVNPLRPFIIVANQSGIGCVHGQAPFSGSVHFHKLLQKLIHLHGGGQNKGSQIHFVLDLIQAFLRFLFGVEVGFPFLTLDAVFIGVIVNNCVLLSSFDNCRHLYISFT